MQTSQLRLDLAECHRDLRPGMVVQIGVFRADKLLERALLVLASGCDLRGALGIAAQDIAEARVLHLVDLVRQPRQLEDAVLEESLDLGFGQRGNIMKARLRQRSDLAAFKHAPIAYK